MPACPRVRLCSASVLGIVGFFVVPVIGLILGFVLGVFLAEWVRLAQPKLAWPSTKSALKAVGLALIIELFFGADHRLHLGGRRRHRLSPRPAADHASGACEDRVVELPEDLREALDARGGRRGRATPPSIG